MAGLAGKAKDAIADAEASAMRVNQALDRYLRSSILGVQQVLVNRAGAILRDVALRSPVDTGRFRAAWGPGFEALGMPEPPISKLTLAAAMEGRRNGSASVTMTDEKAEAIITNGVSYGPFLEAGFSPQAPSGFVRRTLDEHAARLMDDIRRVEVDGVR